MKLPKYKDKTEIPEGFESLYHEVNGEWVTKEPDPPSGGNDDIEKLKTTVDKVRDEVKAAEKKAKAAEDRIKDAENRAKEAEDKLAAKGAGISDDKLKELKDKIQADVRAELQAELAAKDKQIESLTGVQDENRGLKLDQKVKAIMLEKGVLGGKVDDLFILSRGEFDLTENGTPMLKNHPAKDIGIFIEDTLKKSYPEWFKGSQAGGGGAGGHTPSGIPSVGTTPDDVLANPAAAMTAAREAGKT
jgi:hypothetical protein